MFYQVVDQGLIKQIEAWFQKRQMAEETFLRLSRRVGGSRARFAAGDGISRRSFGFVFTHEPDRNHWKKDRHGDYWLPKLSSKTGKSIDGEVRAIQRADGSRGELSKVFCIDDFWKNVGVDKVKGRWIVAIEEGWIFSTNGLKRISDVALERLRRE